MNASGSLSGRRFWQSPLPWWDFWILQGVARSPWGPSLCTARGWSCWKTVWRGFTRRSRARIGKRLSWRRRLYCLLSHLPSFVSWISWRFPSSPVCLCHLVKWLFRVSSGLESRSLSCSLEHTFNIGSKFDAFEFPVNTSETPREIPDQPWFGTREDSSWLLMEVACLLEDASSNYSSSCPLSGRISIITYVFGFLFLTFAIFLLTRAEVSVLLNYFQLRGEDHRWWWRSFDTGGSTALYVFRYFFYYFKQLESNSPATYNMLYTLDTWLWSLSDFYLMTGTIGFLMNGTIGFMSSLRFFL